MNLEKVSFEGSELIFMLQASDAREKIMWREMCIGTRVIHNYTLYAFPGIKSAVYMFGYMYIYIYKW